MEAEALVGRRRSLRRLGKERPSYALDTQTVIDEHQVVRKKPKLSPGKKVCRVSLITPETNVLLVKEELIANDFTKEEVNNNEPVDENKDVCAASEKEPKLDNRVCGEAQQVEGGSDPHTGPVKSDRQRVKETLRVFNTYYLQLIQEEEKRVKEVEEKLSKGSKYKKYSKKTVDNISNSAAKSKLEEMKNGADSEGDLKRASKRPDLKVVSKMQENNQVLYPEKRIGDLPGISVGDQFFSRAEMCVLGLHKHWLNGIDYMGISFAKKVYAYRVKMMEEDKRINWFRYYRWGEQYKGYKFPLAVCIVMSGMYEDDLDKSEEVIYTGQGGHDLLGNKHQIKDQKLERGNLALMNNSITGAPVRVVRGHESKSSYCGKVYTYDGLYKVVKYWAEKGVSGFTVYKYKLKREPGQPFLTTNQVQFTRAQVPQSIAELRGLVCEDISGGQENFPIPATNLVDDPSFAPTDFEYCKTVRLTKSLMLPTSAGGCNCKGECVDPRTCSCARLNGGDFPYVRKDGGRLIEAKAVVFECGPGCGCNSSCVNRTSQQGLKYRLEVFRTANKGWAVRSWDTIPSGAPVCEYTGILKRTNDDEVELENNYIFDIDCLQTMKGLDGRETRPGDIALLSKFDDKKAEAEYCIDAGRVGGVARFINHSCDPNLFVQCVLSTHHDVRMAKVMLFAADTIPPLQELCYDYGYTLDSVVRDGKIVQLPCFCGAAGCRRRLH